MPPPLTAEDQAFLAHYDLTAFPRPSLTVDVVLLTASGNQLQVVLLQRTAPPFRDHWGLPGVFVALGETLEDAARRALAKVGLDPGVASWLEQLYTFGAVDRDPRGRVVTVAYFGLVPVDRLTVGPAASLAPLVVPWEGETGGPVTPDDAGPLAFDHADILGLAVLRLRGKLAWSDVGYALLPAQFTLRQLQELHEAILGRVLNKDSFRRRMTATGLLVPTGEREGEVGHRPAALYRFVRGGSDG